jgi:DNA-binding transcriptional ArsR family regulator
MQTFMAITKALSDPSRVRTLLALKRGELCVCQITELFGYAPSTVSKHLSILQQAGLVRSRKSERWVYYRLADKTAPVAVREALDWVNKSLAQADEAAMDAKKLKQIKKTDLAEICKRQKCCQPSTIIPSGFGRAATERRVAARRVPPKPLLYENIPR